MNFNKSGLDEMQATRHAKIGSQMFVLLSLALLINISLYGVGVRWLDYPTDTMVIVIACLVIYLVRLIIAGAYRHPSVQGAKATFVGLVIAVILAVVFAINLRNLPMLATESVDNYSAIILVGVSVAGLLASGIAAAIKKKRDTTDIDE